MNASINLSELSRKQKIELLALLEEKAKRSARKRFWDFCLWYDRDFFERRGFLEQVADGFQAIHEGQIKALSVSMPPRAGKSYITTLFAAWTLAKKPEGSVMRNTCTSTLYDKFSYDTRAVIRSEKYKQVFPEVELADDKQNLTGWNLKTSRQVGYFGAGVGGTIIGFGASSIAITDDLYKSIEDALSETKNESVQRWKESAHDSRLEKECPKIDIGTRWSKKDVIGKNIEENKYDLSIVIPAMVDGKSFCEDVKTTEEYLEICSSIDSGIWDAEYMQEPAEIKGVLFQRGELKYFTRAELSQEISLARAKDKTVKIPTIGYADIADEGDDFFSAPFAHVFKNKVYISDLVFTQDNVDVTLPKLAKMFKDLAAQYVRVESNNQGSIFIKMLRQLIGSGQVLGINNSSNKHTRIILEYAFIKEYFYFLAPTEYAQGSPYDLFMKQLFNYMKDGSSKHDDAPDSISGLAKFIQAMFAHLFKVVRI